jgi:multidrug resistance efflux pump
MAASRVRSGDYEPMSGRRNCNTRLHPRRLRRILLFLGPLLLAVAGLYFYLSSGRYVSTDNAYVRADKLNVATDISGIVAAIAVTENQRVEKDEILFRLDDEPYRIALAGADAQLGVVRTEIATLQASYRQSLAQIEQTRTDVVGDVTLTTNTALYSSKEKSLAERNQRLGLCTN